MVPGAEVSEVEITQLMEALQAEVKAMLVSGLASAARPITLAEAVLTDGIDVVVEEGMEHREYQDGPTTAVEGTVTAEAPRALPTFPLCTLVAEGVVVAAVMPEVGAQEEA